MSQPQTTPRPFARFMAAADPRIADRVQRQLDIGRQNAAARERQEHFPAFASAPPAQPATNGAAQAALENAEYHAMFGDDGSPAWAANDFASHDLPDDDVYRALFPGER